MPFNVNYNAGGVIDEVKKLKAILGGVLDEVKQVDTILGGIIDQVKVVDLIKKIELLEKIALVERVETIGKLESGILDEVKVVNTLNEILGGTIDRVKLVDEVSAIKSGTLDLLKSVTKVDEIGKITNFPQKTQPFNEMIKVDIPAIEGVYEAEYETPDMDVEILALTVTCSGYGEKDKYDLFVNDKQWFKDWYCSEVREGLFMGSSTFVYSAPAKSRIKLVFHNDSGSAKTAWFGIRMLI